MAKKRICVITASRAEYGLLRWLMQEIKDDQSFLLQIVVTGAHLSNHHGMTSEQIESDGFTIDACVPMDLSDTSPKALSIEVGRLTQGLAVVLDKLQPDLVVILGDRYELLGVATACVIMTVPLAHIAGGEITEGAIDEQIRHAMTKMSHLHFVANATYGARVRQLGEEAWRICVAGEPGLDNLFREEVMSCEALATDIGLDFSIPTALVTFHPVTLELSSLDDQMSALVQALDKAQRRHGLQYLITHPGADSGNDRVVALWRDFIAAGKGRILVSSLGQKRYFSALREATLMIGNSSSGIIEAPSFNLPTVNIGNRQGGRMRAVNVIDVGYGKEDILDGIDRAVTYDRSISCINPYGDGRSSPRILDFIRDKLNSQGRVGLLRKKFVDL